MTVRVFRALSFVAVPAALAGCAPPPPSVSIDVQNGGVNLIPAVIVAAEKVKPTTVPTGNEYEKDLIQAISQSNQQHDEFLRVLRLGNMVPQLRDKGPYTLFAPTDFALSKLPPGTLEDIEKPENQARLHELLQYYLIPGRIDLATLQDTNGEVRTLSGKTVTIRGIDKGVMVNDVSVTHSDSTAYNGIIHWIDGPLMPPG